MTSLATVKPNICEFEESTHTYRRNGVVLPSVTQVIETCLPRTDGAPEQAIEGARRRGNWVDIHIQEYLSTGTVTVIPGSVPDEYFICLEQAIDWLDKELPHASIEVQVRLFGEQEAGTCDLLADEVRLIDIKSTYQISDTVKAQLGGYAELHFEQCGRSRILYTGILHVHKRLPKAVFKEYPRMECIEDWYAVRNFYRRFKRKK